MNNSDFCLVLKCTQPCRKYFILHYSYDFWYIFLLRDFFSFIKFDFSWQQKHKADKDLLYDRIADSYVALFTSINQDVKDKFLLVGTWSLTVYLENNTCIYNFVEISCFGDSLSVLPVYFLHIQDRKKEAKIKQQLQQQE